MIPGRKPRRPVFSQQGSYVVVFKSVIKPCIDFGNPLVDKGPVLQSIVSLTTSLRRQLVKYMLATLSNTLLFFVEKVRIFCSAKDSHIFPTKINSVLII